MKRIEVHCYSGHKGEERPLSFVLNERRVQVVEVLERRLEEDRHSKERRRLFKVKADDGMVYTLVYREVQDQWFLMGNSEDARG